MFSGRVTDGTFCEEHGEYLGKTGIKLENVTLDMLAKAKRVIIEKENATIVEGAGKKQDIVARCNQIRTQVEETTSDYDREKLQERLATSNHFMGRRGVMLRPPTAQRGSFYPSVTSSMPAMATHMPSARGTVPDPSAAMPVSVATGVAVPGIVPMTTATADPDAADAE